MAAFRSWSVVLLGTWLSMCFLLSVCVLFTVRWLRQPTQAGWGAQGPRTCAVHRRARGAWGWGGECADVPPCCTALLHVLAKRTSWLGHGLCWWLSWSSPCYDPKLTHYKPGVGCAHSHYFWAGGLELHQAACGGSIIICLELIVWSCTRLPAAAQSSSV